METLRYPARIEEDGDGFLVTFPDFPDAVTAGDTKEEALHNAAGSLMEVIAARIAHKDDLPTPSAAKGNPLIMLPPQSAAKALLYRAMRDEGVTKAELARRLHWKFPQVDRLFKFGHNSKLEQMTAAFGALGKKIVIGVTE